MRKKVQTTGVAVYVSVWTLSADVEGMTEVVPTRASANWTLLNTC